MTTKPSVFNTMPDTVSLASSDFNTYLNNLIGGVDVNNLFNTGTNVTPIINKAMTNNGHVSGFANDLFYKGKSGSFWDNFRKPNDTTVTQLNPKTGQMETKVISGGFMSSDMVQAGKGLYGIGMDWYSMHNTNKNAKLLNRQLADTRHKYAKDYSLAATQYENLLAGKEASMEAAAKSGFTVTAPKYKHVSETY